jgi:hypothetical protein
MVPSRFYQLLVADAPQTHHFHGRRYRNSDFFVRFSKHARSREMQFTKTTRSQESSEVPIARDYSVGFRSLDEALK